MSELKDTLKSLIPPSVLSFWYRINAKRHRAELDRCRSPQETFTTIYRRGHWGKSGDPADPFFSGSGSRDPRIVEPYIKAVEAVLTGYGRRLDVADLGCGDFAVGAQIRRLCGRYYACDVVQDVIDRHKIKHANSDVIFQVVDITQDDLPPADMAFIRQVLQHLSNDDIKRVVPKLYRYRYLVITEHLPVSPDFESNLDKKRGLDIRLRLGTKGSGIVLTEPPFDLKVKSSKILCEADESIEGVPGVVRTTLYEL
jgi:hypothetical protein